MSNQTQATPAASTAAAPNTVDENETVLRNASLSVQAAEAIKNAQAERARAEEAEAKLAELQRENTVLRPLHEKMMASNHTIYETKIKPWIEYINSQKTGPKFAPDVQDLIQQAYHSTNVGAQGLTSMITVAHENHENSRSQLQKLHEEKLEADARVKELEDYITKNASETVVAGAPRKRTITSALSDPVKEEAKDTPAVAGASDSVPGAKASVDELMSMLGGNKTAAEAAISNMAVTPDIVVGENPTFDAIFAMQHARK